VALSEGKIYDFRVAAVVNGTVGEYSQVIRVIPTPSVQPTPTPSPTPSPSTQAVEAPLNLYAVANTTPGTVRLTWSKSPTSGPVSRYRIEISNPTSGWVLVGDTPGTGLAADVNSLYAGVAYQFRVSAVGDTQTSAPSNVFTYTIPQTNITPPGVVQNLRASLSGTDVMLAWNAPSVLNGAPVTSHKLQVSIDNISWIDLADGNSSLSAILKGLESKRSYFFRVAAVNSAGTGLWSQVIKVTMP
jgi:titin